MKKTVNIIVLAIFLLLSLQLQGCKKQPKSGDDYDELFEGGHGFVPSPYKIATAEQLLLIGSEPNLMRKDYILIKDIDLNPHLRGGRIFRRALIAPDTDDANGFQGTAYTGNLDGDGHTIKNLTIRSRGGDYLGLFGKVDFYGRIDNLGLENVSIVGTDGSHYIGAIAGEAIHSLFINCYATGKISGGNKSGQIGGLAGSVDERIVDDCYSTVNVFTGKNSKEIGGLVGRSGSKNDNRITNSYASGNISCSDNSSFIGGLIGSNKGVMSNSYATCNFSVGENYEHLGELVGQNSGHVINCYFPEDFDVGGIENNVGLPLTQEQMRQQSSFADWDFENIWTINDTMDYPKLRPGPPWPPKPTPPDLSSCTRLVVFGSLEYIISGTSSDPNFFGVEEKKILRSKKYIVTDRETIEAYAHEVNKGVYKASKVNYGIGNPSSGVSCYRNEERIEFFNIFPRSIRTEYYHWFGYSEDLPYTTLIAAASNVKPLILRYRCWRNIKKLHDELIKIRNKTKAYPSPDKWCDAIAPSMRRAKDEKWTYDTLTCPSARLQDKSEISQGEPDEPNSPGQSVPPLKCHYAMNPDCEPNSPGDMVLLFETKTGWNQYGGPELFTFDNHNPKGGCVLLNDGTVKFVRTKEELHNLRWK